MIGVLAVTSALGAAGKLASGLLGAKARRGEFDDQIRALQMKRDLTLGTARLRSAASGFEMGSKSTDMYLASLAGEYDYEINRLREAQKTTYGANILESIFGASSSILGGLSAINKARGI